MVTGTSHTQHRNRQSVRRRRLAAGALTAAMVSSTVSGVLTGTPATVAAPGPACPAPFPSDEVVVGQPVEGLATTRGHTPGSFTGEVIGRLDNGVMPGVDLLVVRLTSPEIDRIGIWHGMSGAPVYAADGRLVGAVGYGFSISDSPVAGVVAGEDILDLLPAAARAGAVRVPVPPELARRLVAGGDATAGEVRQGLQPLAVPTTISGASERAAEAIADRLTTPWTRVMRGGAGTAREAAPLPVVPGGGMAVLETFGDITAGAIGTATAVCEGAVVGFGHPFIGLGHTSLGLNGTDVLDIQEDLLGSYSLVNVGSVVGRINQDRHVGVAGRLGDAPRSVPVTSTVRRGSDSRTGRTDVYDWSWLDLVVEAHVESNLARSLGLGAGTARTTMTITGRLPDKKPFTVRRSGETTTGRSVTWDVASDMSRVITGMQQFPGASITSVDLKATMARSLTRAVITGVSIRKAGRWVAVRPGSTLDLAAGTTAVLRVGLRRNTGGGAWHETLRLPVPAEAAGASTTLSVLSGGAEAARRMPEVETAAAAVAAFNARPQRSDVVVSLPLREDFGGTQRATSDAGLAVSPTEPFRARVKIR